jgi:excisionase family DNA binding protein
MDLLNDGLTVEELKQLEGGLRVIGNILARSYAKELRPQDVSQGNPLAKKMPDYTLSNLPNNKLTLSVSEVSKLLGLSKGTTYELIRQGQIPSIMFGKRILVPKVRLEMMLRGQEAI